MIFPNFVILLETLDKLHTLPSRTYTEVIWGGCRIVYCQYTWSKFTNKEYANFMLILSLDM